MERLLAVCKERDSYGDSVVKQFVARVKEFDVDWLMENKAVYHKECYAEYANKEKLERTRRRYEEAQSSISSSVTKRKAGRPSTSSLGDEDEALRSTRSKVASYDKEKCIICQVSGGKCHKVQFMKTVEKFLEIASQLEDKSLYIRLNSICIASDAVANDVIYHLDCWVKVQRKVKPKSTDLQEINLVSQVILDIDLLNIIEYALSHPTGIVLDMNMINRRYKDLLSENGLNECDMKESYKPYLKELISENIPKAKLVKSPRVNEPERLTSDDTQSSAIDNVIERSSYEEFNLIFDVFKLVRKELLDQKQWKFRGTFSNFAEPKLLSTLLKWILIGPSQDLNENEDNKELSKRISIISQIIMQSVKTKRQIQYHAKKEHKEPCYDNKETPLSIGEQRNN